MGLRLEVGCLGRARDLQACADDLDGVSSRHGGQNAVVLVEVEVGRLLGPAPDLSARGHGGVVVEVEGDGVVASHRTEARRHGEEGLLVVPNSSLFIWPIIRNIRSSGLGTSGSGTSRLAASGVMRNGTTSWAAPVKIREEGHRTVSPWGCCTRSPSCSHHLRHSQDLLPREPTHHLGMLLSYVLLHRRRSGPHRSPPGPLPHTRTSSSRPSDPPFLFNSAQSVPARPFRKPRARGAVISQRRRCSLGGAFGAAPADRRSGRSQSVAQSVAQIVVDAEGLGHVALCREGLH